MENSAPNLSPPAPAVCSGCFVQTQWDHGAVFLKTWSHWRAQNGKDTTSPALLHFVAILSSPPAMQFQTEKNCNPELVQLLSAQWWGLTPGLHRLSFEQGRVLLTLCVGAQSTMLDELDVKADIVLHTVDPIALDVRAIKALAHLCQRGSYLVFKTSQFFELISPSSPRVISQGLQPQRAPGPHAPPPEHCGFIQTYYGWQYAPHWTLRAERNHLHASKTPLSSAAPMQPHTPFIKRNNSQHAANTSSALVVGAGLAGAAVAASLARRGWRVRVLDAGSTPANGASALPAGLFVPIVSRDDNVLSRLIRCGIRITLVQVQSLLIQDVDWALTGCAEHAIDAPIGLADLGSHGAAWSTAMLSKGRSAGFASHPHGPNLMHPIAGWIKPSAWIAKQLRLRGITWQGNASVQRLHKIAGQWHALDAQGGSLAKAPIMVIACGAQTEALLKRSDLPCPVLQTVRGQVTWGIDTAPHIVNKLAHNGHGHCLPHIPTQKGRAITLTGATYQRGDCDTRTRDEDDLENIQRLARLQPEIGLAMRVQQRQNKTFAWAGLRCTSADRAPHVGAIATNLYLSTAMGSRGLSLSALAGECIAAQLCAEPSPLSRSLFAAIQAIR